MSSRIGSWIEQVVGAPLPVASPLISIDGIAERRAFYESLPPADDPDGAVVVHDQFVLRDGPERLVAEVYKPSDHGQRGPLPPFVFMHGGAFCIWNARMVRRATMRIAAAGFVVVSLNQRLAPEHPYPAALQDVIHAAHWIEDHAADLGADTSAGLSIGGDSSGANLAASATSYFLAGYTSLTSPEHQDKEPIAIRQALLLCGIYDIGKRMVERPSGPGTTEIMVNLAYLGPQFLTKHADPLVSPARARNLGEFPRTFVACGSRDNTLPQSLAFTSSLAEADANVTLSVFPGGDHEMLLLTEEQLPGVDAEWARIQRWLTAP